MIKFPLLRYCFVIKAGFDFMEVIKEKINIFLEQPYSGIWKFIFKIKQPKLIMPKRAH